MSRMRSNLKNALYDLLDWLEKERPELIQMFWKAVFKEVTMKHYPTLRRLHGSLMEGQFSHSSRNEHETEKSQAPSWQSQTVTSRSYNPHKETFRKKTKQEARDERTKKKLSGNETEEKTNATPAKRKTRKVEESTSEEEEKEKQRKPLGVEAPVGRRRTRKIQMCEFSFSKPHFCSWLHTVWLHVLHTPAVQLLPWRKERKATSGCGPSTRRSSLWSVESGRVFWTEIEWLKVTGTTQCGRFSSACHVDTEKFSSFFRSHLSGEKCILHDKRWFTPPEFEKLGGKESSKKWKQSIQCVNTPLGKLIQVGKLLLFWFV